MRQALALFAVLAAFAAAPAALAQQDLQQQNDGKDQAQRAQERNWEQHRNDAASGQSYRQQAAEARRHAEHAKTPGEKAMWLKMASLYDTMAGTTARP